MDFKAGSKQQAEYNPEATMILDVAKAAPPAADLELDIKLDEPTLQRPLTRACTSTSTSAHLFRLPPKWSTWRKRLPAEMRSISTFNIGAPTAPKSAPKAEAEIDLGSINLDLGKPSMPPSLLQETK